MAHMLLISNANGHGVRGFRWQLGRLVVSWPICLGPPVVPRFLLLGVHRVRAGYHYKAYRLSMLGSLGDLAMVDWRVCTLK